MSYPHVTYKEEEVPFIGSRLLRRTTSGPGSKEDIKTEREVSKTEEERTINVKRFVCEVRTRRQKRDIGQTGSFSFSLYTEEINSRKGLSMCMKTNLG